MIPGWTYNELDREVAAELQDFLPDRIFDGHAHLYRAADLSDQTGSMAKGPEEVTVEVWREHMARYFGKSHLEGALFVPAPLVPITPDGSGLDRANDFLIEQLKTAPASRGLLLIAPEYPPDRVAEYLNNPQIVGFKPYHTFSKQEPTFEAPLGSFLPEWAWEMAAERDLVITLHMVRHQALADPDNQREIRKMCLKYPEAKLVLAHAARGFHAPNTIKGLPALRGLENIWFDTAAVCESAAIIAILKEFGPRRVMWGSDFPVSEIRGKCVTVGDGFAWLQWNTIDWDSRHIRANPILVGLESLRAVQDVANSFGLNDQDLEDIFYSNARRLLGIEKESGTVAQDLYRHAKERISGGTQLLSKRPEMMAPDQWPAYFREARGCETWDVDGRHYYDMSYNGIGACLLGFRDPDVTRAVRRCINLGSMCTLNPPEEVQLADRLCEIHPWAQQVRFARSGGEAVAIAVRIARATTDRSMVAICGYHGWHDWYLAANLGESDALRGHLLPGLDPLGVPRELRGTTATFTYNNREEFTDIMDRYGDRLAAVVMEPCRNHDPDPGFLELVRDRAYQRGAALIFDEISIGWRLVYGGAHLKFGVDPDMAVFAKALGNGHPIGAIIGTRDAMAGAYDSFISSTYWTESVGPVAALATLEKMQKVNVRAHVAHIGQKVQEYWQQLSEKHGLATEVSGYSCLAHFTFRHELSNALRTLYTQLMLERGFLAGALLYPTLAHTDEITEQYGAAIDEVFGEIATALAAGKIEERLKGPVAHSTFQRLI